MYTINVLSNEDFEKLPYKHVKEALGCADAKTGQAYIRKTGIDGIDLLTIQHELEELVAKTSPHEVDGIRYKKGRDIASNVLPIAASMLLGPMGPVIAGLGAAATSYGSQKYISSSHEVNPWKVGLSGLGGYGAGSGMAPGVAGASANGAGYFGQVGAGLKGALGMGMPATTGGAAGAASTFGSASHGLNLGSTMGASGANAGFMGTGVLGAGGFGGAGSSGATGMMSGTSGISGATGMNSLLQSGANGAGAYTSHSAGNILGAGAGGSGSGIMQGIQKFAGNAGDLVNPMQLMGLGVMGMSSLPVMPSAPQYLNG